MDNEKKYVICRGNSSGVFAGYFEKRQGSEVTLTSARRIWYWKGAASLSQLAIDGVKYPDECRFPEALSSIEILDVVEIIPVTKKAQKSIEEVFIWEA